MVLELLSNIAWSLLYIASIMGLLFAIGAIVLISIYAVSVWWHDIRRIPRK
jgi:hypothetical protein